MRLSGSLGITVANNMAGSSGVVIVALAEGRAAHREGLVCGAVIFAINGEFVDDHAVAVARIDASCEAEGSVTLLISHVHTPADFERVRRAAVIRSPQRGMERHPKVKRQASSSTRLIVGSPRADDVVR